MHATVRTPKPYMKAGVALVGASVVAVAPVSVPPADVEVRDMPVASPAVASRAVQLAALVNPLEVFGEVLADTLANTGALAGEIANPAPILQLIATQVANVTDPAAWVELVTNLTDPGALLGDANDVLAGGNELLNNFLTQLAEVPLQQLQLALENLQNGEITTALSRILQTIPNMILLGPGLSNPAVIEQITESLGELLPPLRHLVTTLGSTQFLIGAGLPVLQSVGSIVNSVGAAAEDLVAAMQAGDLEGVFNAVVTGTANIVNALQTTLLSPTQGLPAALLRAIDMLGAPSTSMASTTGALSAEAPAANALPAGGTTVDVKVADTEATADSGAVEAANAAASTETESTPEEAAETETKAETTPGAEVSDEPEAKGTEESETAEVSGSTEESEAGQGKADGTTDATDSDKADSDTTGAVAGDSGSIGSDDGSDD